MATDYSTQITDQWTCFEEQINAAMAILDCAAAVQAEGDLKTGYRVMHESLPNVLKHVIGLLQGAHNDADVLREMALNKIGRSIEAVVA